LKKNFITFCISIYNENYQLLKSLGLTPVGLGNQNFSGEWFRDNTGQNISKKNKYYGEYTFHYWIWKNYLAELKNKNWIGFCTYRRFWICSEKQNLNSIQELEKIIMRDYSIVQNNFDVILTKPISLKKTKFSKVIKNLGYYKTLTNLEILFKNRHNLYEHFSIFHGEYYLKKAISIMENSEKQDFLYFLKTHKFNAHNMFCVKNSEILEKFYESIFDWLFACEKIFDIQNLKSYEVRKLGYLAELYLNFYFVKNYKVFEKNYIFFDTHKL
jgi:hypothetical protein